MEKEKKTIKGQVEKNRDEFVDFLTKYNVIQLAIGVVVGTAVKDLVSSIVNDLVMPLVEILTPGGSWKDWGWEVAGVKFGFGGLLASLLDFMVVALVVFVVLRKVLNINKDENK